jgi:hypothetical protein
MLRPPRRIRLAIWKRTARKDAAVALFLYAVLVVASLYPQSLAPGTAIAYVGDSLESVYIVAWNVHQFFRSPRHLFDANILYPVEHSLALTDHRLLPSLLVAPVLWTTRNPVLAYNVAVAAAFLLAAFGGRHLARTLGIGPLGAWTAGALYAFHTYQVNEAPRLNIIAHGFIPLALAELLRFLRTGRRTHAVRLGGLMLLQALSSNYHLLYASLLLGIVVVLWAVARPRETLSRLAPLALAAALAGAAYAPIALPYVRMARAHVLSRELPEGIDLRHYVSTLPSNVMYGPIGGPVRLQQKAAHFVGFVSLALAMVAVIAWVARRRTAAPDDPDDGVLPPTVFVPAAAGLALLFVALSLGRDVYAFGHAVGPGPYRLLYRFVPGFQLVRIPERFALLAMLFVALLVGRGLSLIARRAPLVLAVFLAALVPFEHLSPLPLVERIPVGRRVPRVYGWLAGEEAQAVAEVPIHGEGLIRKETLEAYFSTYHWRPVIHGYTAYPLLITKVMRNLAALFPAEVALQAFDRIGVDTVIAHLGRDDAPPGFDAAVAQAVAAQRLVRVARFEGEGAHVYEGNADEVYRIRRSAIAPAAPFPAGQPLREPGWAYRTKAGDPLPAADGDMRTAWSVPRALNGDEFYEVRFGRLIRVSGVVLRLRRDSAFPNRFRIGGLDGSGHWTELAHLDDAHWLQLLDLVRTPAADAALGFDLGSRELGGVILQVGEGGTSFEGWSIPEIEVWVR